MKKSVFALMAVAAMASVQANEVVGELRNVQGNITVTSNGSVVQAVNGTPLMATSRILVANGAKATVMLTEGCVIPLKSNQFLALNPKLACTQQVAAVSQLAAPYRLAQAPVGGGAALGGGGIAGGTLTGAVVVGGVVGTLVVVSEVENRDLSGN